MKEEFLLLLSDLQKLINQVVLIDYTIIILGDVNMKEMVNKIKKVLLNSLEMFAAAYCSNSIYRPF